MNNNLFKKFLEFGVGSIVVLILGFISSPIITRLIDPEQFGKMSMFNTVTSIISTITILGLDQSFARFFYDEEEYNRDRLLIKSIKIPLIISFIVILIINAKKVEISNFIIGEYSNEMFYLISLQVLSLLINRFSLLSIRMNQKGKLYSVIQVIGKLSYILLVLTIFKFNGNDYTTLVYAIILSNIITIGISLFYQKHNLINGIKNNSKLNVKNFELIKYGYPLMFTVIITWLFQSIDKISIKMFNGYNELGIYSSAFTIIALLSNFQNMFSTFWTPVSLEKYKNNPDDTAFFRSINRYVSFLFLSMSVIIIMFKDIIILILGSKYSNASFVMPFLVFAPIMYTVSETTVIGISFLKKPKLHIYIAIIACVTNIIGNIILVPIIGAKGAAISTGISYIIFFIARTWISTTLYKVNYGIKDFYISIIALSIFAFYMSFNKIDVNSILLGIGVLIVIALSYKDIVKNIIFKIKAFYCKNIIQC